MQDEYKKWHPDDIKIVPKDLKLTPKIVLHWFLDDGSTSWNGNKNNVQVRFCTESFQKSDCEFLVDLLCCVGIQSQLSKTDFGYGYRVGIYKKKSVFEFFDYIGDCPLEIRSMQYKWKIPNLSACMLDG